MSKQARARWLRSVKLRYHYPSAAFPAVFRGFYLGFSADGRYVTYESRAPDLDIFVGDLATRNSWMVFHGVKDKGSSVDQCRISLIAAASGFDAQPRSSTGLRR